MLSNYIRRLRIATKNDKKMQNTLQMQKIHKFDNKSSILYNYFT